MWSAWQASLRLLDSREWFSAIPGNSPCMSWAEWCHQWSFGFLRYLCCRVVKYNSRLLGNSWRHLAILTRHELKIALNSPTGVSFYAGVLDRRVGRGHTLSVGLEHVIQYTTCVFAHGDIRVSIHSPVRGPLIPHNPVAVPVRIVSATRTTATLVISAAAPTATSLHVLIRIVGYIGVAYRLYAMVHIHKSLGTSRCTCNDAVGIILPGGGVETHHRGTVGGQVTDSIAFVLLITVTSRTVCVTDAFRRRVAIALNVAIATECIGALDFVPRAATASSAARACLLLITLDGTSTVRTKDREKTPTSTDIYTRTLIHHWFPPLLPTPSTTYPRHNSYHSPTAIHYDP